MFAMVLIIGMFVVVGVFLAVSYFIGKARSKRTPLHMLASSPIAELPDHVVGNH